MSQNAFIRIAFAFSGVHKIIGQLYHLFVSHRHQRSPWAIPNARNPRIEFDVRRNQDSMLSNAPEDGEGQMKSRSEGQVEPAGRPLCRFQDNYWRTMPPTTTVSLDSHASSSSPSMLAPERESNVWGLTSIQHGSAVVKKSESISMLSTPLLQGGKSILKKLGYGHGFGGEIVCERGRDLEHVTLSRVDDGGNVVVFFAS
ncbi:hypothetical protein B0H10DRAFT_1973509 [Mycena sp. CBHHK59/15]|nr:hypothetical protein B0H10DRAFT_1973509 [Mycena sp. CBHHK59/15]